MYELIELDEVRRNNIQLTVYDTFDETARHLLGNAVEDDMRIFVVISDEARIRNALCEVWFIIIYEQFCFFISPLLHTFNWFSSVFIIMFEQSI